MRGTQGLDPKSSWPPAKTSDANLRSAAYRLAVVGIQSNPIIHAHCLRKRAQGKSAMNAVGHCMAKALAVAWGVIGQAFDPTRGGAQM